MSESEPDMSQMVELEGRQFMVTMLKTVMEKVDSIE